MVTPTIRNIMGNNVHKKSNEKATSNIRFISLFSIFPRGSLRMLRMGTRRLSFKIHTVAQVVAHIGYAVEMYQVVFAIINDRHDTFA